MLAWIYLQVRLVLYAVQIDTVKDGNLYPRSLSGKHQQRQTTSLSRSGHGHFSGAISSISNKADKPHNQTNAQQASASNKQR